MVRLADEHAEGLASWSRVRERHRQLYNAALEHRITAYRRAGISIRKGDQEKEVTEIRALHPEYGALNAQSLQVTLDRLDKAIKAFFRRVRSVQAPGFPRFKSRDRFSGFSFKSHGDGWKLFAGEWAEGGKQKRSGTSDLLPGQMLPGPRARKVSPARSDQPACTCGPN